MCNFKYQGFCKDFYLKFHVIFAGELMFNHIEPDLPPDFIFDCHTFEPDLDNVKVNQYMYINISTYINITSARVCVCERLCVCARLCVCVCVCVRV